MSTGKVLVTVALLALIPRTDSNNKDAKSKALLGFCESEFYVPKSKSSCPNGFNLGQRIPKCVCLKGIYRMYFSNCEMADGFAEEVCTLLNDTEHDVRIKAIKLTKEPNWEKTGVAFNRLIGTAADFDYISDGGKAKMTGRSFYSINGEALISTREVKGKWKHDICVQRASLSEIICFYRHIDNVDKWHVDASTDVLIKPTCGSNFKPLVKKRCFNPLTLLDSDCQVPCVKSNLIGTGPMAGENNYEGIPNLEGNCTDPQALFTHENKFIDRQLLMYMVIEQLSKEGNVSVPEPMNDGIIKTYKIYNLVKDIASRSCVHPYLRIEVLDLASKFFMYLHRANKMQYDITLSDEDFKWIEAILTKCAGNVTLFKLKSHGGLTEGCFNEGSYLAQGYCNPNVTGGCDFRGVRISPLYSNYKKKHYIPEFVWLFLDIVHMNCFRDFAESYRMFHVMEQVYEQLFTTPIRDYWHYPTWNDATKFSMLTVNADVVMWNAQMCAESIYDYNDRKLHRLSRPPQFRYPMRKKRAVESISAGYDIGCAKSKTDFKIPEGCSEKKQLNPVDAKSKPYVIRVPSNKGS